MCRAERLFPWLRRESISPPAEPGLTVGKPQPEVEWTISRANAQFRNHNGVILNFGGFGGLDVCLAAHTGDITDFPRRDGDSAAPGMPPARVASRRTQGER